MELREVVDRALASCVRYEPLSRVAFLRCFATPLQKPRGTVIIFHIEGAERFPRGAGGHAVNYNKQGTSIHAEVLLLSAVRAMMLQQREGDGEDARREPANAATRSGCTLHCYSTYSPCGDCVEYIQEFRASTGVQVLMHCCRLYELDMNRRRSEAQGVLRSLSSLGREFRLMGARDVIALLQGGHLSRKDYMRGNTADAAMDEESEKNRDTWVIERNIEPLVEMAGFGDDNFEVQMHKNNQIRDAYVRYAGAVSLILVELRVNPDKYPFLADFLGHVPIDWSRAMSKVQGRCRGASSEPGIELQRPVSGHVGERDGFERALGAYGLFLHPRIVSRETDLEHIKRDLIAVMRKHNFQDGRGHQKRITKCLKGWACFHKI